NTGLYENILKNFYNKNRIYLDIRNPENKQLNFYDNYSKYIKLKIKDSSKLPPNNVFASFSDIKANDPSKTNKTYLTLDPGFFDSGTAPNNEFEIALPDGKEVPFTYGGKNYSYINNETPSVWVENCFVSNQFPANLFGSTNFIRNFSRNKDKARYSSSIHLSVKNYTDDLQKPFCTYIRINYLKESDTYIYPKGDKCCGQNPILPAAEHEICCGKSLKFPEPLIEPGPDIDKTVKSYEYLDNFFTPFGMLLPQVVPNTLPNGISSNIYYDPKYLDNTKIGGLRMMAYPGIAQDKSGRVTLFAVPADIRNPTRNIIESGISFSGLVSKGSNDLFIEYISKKFKSTKASYKKVLLEKGDIGEPNDRLLELISFDNNTDTDVLKTVSTETLAWLTIEKNDFERLARINSSRGNNPYTDSITNVTHKSDFTDPAKTYLGLKLASTGKAKDKNNGGADIDYVKYEFILRNETYNPSKNITEFKSVSTGVFTYSLRIEGPRITDKRFFPSLAGREKPFTIETNPNGGFRLKSTIYLLPDANITKEELWEYLQYIQCNIRQVWTNRFDINPDTGHPYNCGQYNVGLLYNSNNFVNIDAENIIVKVGTALQASSLRPGECAFRVRKRGTAVTFTRSFAMADQHIGVLFYDPIPGARTRYDEDGDNTPAHEFGHLMGLSDRYTSTGVANPSTHKMVGPFEGNKPAFMDDAPSFDPEYTANYNWVYNLYSTGVMLRPSSQSLSKLEGGRESAFDALRNDPSLVPKFPTPETPARYGRICTFITSKQWQIIMNYASVSGPKEASLNPALSNSNYVFFKDFNVTPPAGPPDKTKVDVSFIGFSFNAGLRSAVSDLLYQPVGALSPDGMMRNRIGTDNSIFGYFSPYAGALSLDRNTVENNAEEMVNVERSGFIALKKIIMGLSAEKIGAAIQKILPDYDGVNKKIYLTVLDPYLNYGDGNAAGREIWNYSNSGPITEKVGSYTITYLRHPYRPAIIQRIQGKS
ncbi:MAG: hypothetical protein KDC56_12320, partial [Flavobacteriaceae bacterium]|nr:hypothetical protein [Flavobacteriaceae bacterium]